MRLLVTGGAGFIGSNFILFMLKHHPNDKIINLDKLTYAGNIDNLKSIRRNSNYRFVKGDICDKEMVNKLIRDVDAVVHFAAESHVDRSIINSDTFVKTNILGTQVLLDAAYRNGMTRFHHISTDEVFGELGHEGRFSERTNYNPRSPYSASKAGADHLVMAYYHTHGLPITISNSCNNYGPYQFPEKIIPLFITHLIEGRKIPVYGKGQNVRQWIHVEDHCGAIDLILRNGKIGETYCVGGETEISNIDLAKLILHEMGLSEEFIEFVEDRKGHDFRYSLDYSKISKELKWRPRTAFEIGIKRTIRWYQENKEWWERLKKRK